MNLENLNNLTGKYQRDTVHKAELWGGILAAQRVNDHMRRVEDAAEQTLELQRQANSEQRKQNWITNRLAEGWTMDEVNEEIAAGEARDVQRRQEAYEAEEAARQARWVEAKEAAPVLAFYFVLLALFIFVWWASNVVAAVMLISIIFTVTKNLLDKRTRKATVEPVA